MCHSVWNSLETQADHRGDDFYMMVLLHADGEVGGAGIDSDSKTISFSSHGKRSRDGCGALLPRCGAWNHERHRKERRNVGVWYHGQHWEV